MESNTSNDNENNNTSTIPQNNSTHISNDNNTHHLPMDKVRTMIDACAQNNIWMIQQLLQEDRMYARQQDSDTGLSPLMMASQNGHLQLVQELLQYGAPWNAVDRQYKCAGTYATYAEHWDIVNELVNWGTRSELILGKLQQRTSNSNNSINESAATNYNKDDSHHHHLWTEGDNENDTSTKPDYLQQRLRYNEDGTALLDADNDAVMMEWETPIMRAHAQILLGDIPPTHRPHRRVLNIGFGMGIIDTILQQEFGSIITQHYIIEAHSDVYQNMIHDGWDHKYPGVTICHGKWQEVLPRLVASAETMQFDAIFFDTYAEHAMDMEDFHRQMLPLLLAKPHGIYSFFNGLAPDNLFFHGVACNVIKLQLDTLGFDTEFLTCQIQIQSINKEQVWQGIRRKYWHDRDVYYLPRITWNQEFLGRKTKAQHEISVMSNQEVFLEEASNLPNNDVSPTKRQRMIE